MARTTAPRRSSTTDRARELQAKSTADRKKVDAKADHQKITRRTKAEPSEAVGQKPLSKAKTSVRTATTPGKTVKKRKSTRQRPMKVEDLVPGPLPVDTQAPQQTGIPRKIRL